MPFVEMAQILGLTEGAVRKRVKELIATRVIKRFTIIAETQSKVRAFVLVTSTPQIPLPEISAKIAVLPHVTEAHEVSGEFDIICFVAAETIGEVNSSVDRIRSVKGVVRTITTFVLR